MNKNLFKWGLSLLSLSLLAACGNSGGQSTGASTPASSPATGISTPDSHATGVSTGEDDSHATGVSTGEDDSHATGLSTGEDDSHAAGEDSGEVGAVTYYLVGTFNDWTQMDEDYAMAPVIGSEGTYTITEVNLKANAQIKVMDSDSNWYPEENIVIAEAGAYTVSFCATGAIDEFSHGQINVVRTGDSTEPETDTYYFLSGDFNSWAKKDDNFQLELMEEKKDGKDQYMIQEVILTAGGLKVMDSDGVWYPGGMDNDYKIANDGVYNVYFCPEGGVTDWYMGYFFVAAAE